jgi:hypothetical protein
MKVALKAAFKWNEKNLLIMNQLSFFAITALRKLYAKIFHIKPHLLPECEQDPDKASQTIYDALLADKPCMIARLGSTELSTMVNYLGVTQQKRNIWNYIKGEALPWWWNNNMMNQMQQWSGFFPPTKEKVEQFCELMMEDMKKVDVLGSWQSNENYFEKELIFTKKIWLIFLDPFWTETPWTKALEGKKVLVVHPFAELIESQYRNKRTKLFDNNNTLPEFELKTIKAVQSIGGERNGFKDWFDALGFMKNQIDQVDFDICLLGCGAYGFPLAAHIKSKGKKAVHWGGSLQLLFGIIGKRWEDPDYGSRAKKFCSKLNYPKLINENWVRPTEMKTKYSDKVENGCYW